jgi:hypothetical protein
VLHQVQQLLQARWQRRAFFFFFFFVGGEGTRPRGWNADNSAGLLEHKEHKTHTYTHTHRSSNTKFRRAVMRQNDRQRIGTEFGDTRHRGWLEHKNTQVKQATGQQSQHRMGAAMWEGAVDCQIAKGKIINDGIA